VLCERYNLRVQGQLVGSLEGIALALPAENQAMRLAFPVTLIDGSNSPSISSGISDAASVNVHEQYEVDCE
jgi:hypothetical protein